MARQQNDSRHDWRRVLTHPLMGTLVPVWFMAAFALSALAVRGELIEQMVLALHINAFVPMAEPPLGVTARLLIAGAFGLVGALLGHLVLVWLLRDWPVGEYPAGETDSTDYRRRRYGDVHPDAPARRPIHAHDELGAYGFDHTGHEPHADDLARRAEPLAQAAPSYIPAPAPAAMAQQEPLVLATPVAAEPAPLPLAQYNQPAPLSPLDPVRGTPLTPFEAPAMSSAPASWASVPNPAPRLSVVAPQEVDAAAVPAPQSAPPQPAPLQPEVAPIALEQDGEAPLPLRGIPRWPGVEPEPAGDAGAALRLKSAPLEALGHVELMERLALAMQRRQDAQSQASPAPSAAAHPREGASVQASRDSDAQTSAALRAALAGLRQVQ